SCSVLLRSSGRTRNLIRKAVAKNQKINSRAISKTFESTVSDEVFTPFQKVSFQAFKFLL
ncbi:hypothetical protein, partial [Escherichia coli]|uniref:hypothetical protein n=1 Tax=Escherichia coli TaxID=562 RepID=UPI00194317B2